VFLGGNWEETTADAATKYYQFNNAMVALRSSSALTYLHPDHLGSVSVISDTSTPPTASLAVLRISCCHSGQSWLPLPQLAGSASGCWA
jgi:hypothetical protein